MKKFNNARSLELIEAIPRSTQERYEEYWLSIVPKTASDYFRRWLFAFASIHTTWQRNVELYKDLSNLEWLGSLGDLYSTCFKSSAGMHNLRTSSIWSFSKQYWLNPGWFVPGPFESWSDCRDRLVKHVKGIGFVKVSFALEMLDPLACRVVCLDTHMLQMYGYSPGSSIKCKIKYEQIENHWNSLCDERGISPVIARHIVWDTIQNKKDTSRYWSYCLEYDDYQVKEPFNNTLAISADAAFHNRECVSV